ncbi:hypothetical protein [Enterococcus sp. LJL90]
MIGELWRAFKGSPEEKLQLLQLQESASFKKIPSDEIPELIAKAAADGKNLAASVEQKFPDYSLAEILKSQQLKVSFAELPISEKFISLGAFELPNQITINQSFQTKDAYFKKAGLPELLFENWQQVAIAHELFHFFAEPEELFVKSYRLSLWSLGFYQHQTSIGSLEEIAAMVFAKELLQLNYYPYLLNLFLPAAFYPQEAEGRLTKLFKRID